MIPGPTLIKACPNCKSKHSYFTLLSGNTFAAKLYSDTKIIYPMSPTHPIYYQCTVCDYIFETEKARTVGRQKGDNLFEEGEGHPDFKQLGPDEYMVLKALNAEKLKKDKKLLFKLCLLQHQAFNDRTRNRNPIFIKKSDETNYRENALQLIGVLEENSDNNLLLIGELYRNIGEFEKAKEYLSKVAEPQYKKLTYIIRQEINNGNRDVVMLDGG